MRLRITKRDVAAAVLISLVAGILFASPLFARLQGLSLDALTALRWEFLGSGSDAASSPVVVVAIDEETYRTPPFRGSPTLTWTREIGRVLSAIVEGGARVVGFDLIFPTSIEQSEIMFGDEPIGARMRGFDRDFLRALAASAAAGKLVLGEIQSRDDPVRPSPGQRAAVRQQGNIRALNVHTDADEVIRRLPLTFQIDGKAVPSMAVELAARALGDRPAIDAEGSMTLGGYRVPSAVPNTLTLNLRGGGRDFPTYSFADLRACAEKGDPEFFRRQFGGKVVIFGTSLDFEDRKLTSMRLSSGLEGQAAPRCALPAAGGARHVAFNTMAGVFVHATAVRNLVEKDAVVELAFALRAAIAAVMALVAAMAACMFAPVVALAALLGVIAGYTAAAVGLFVHSLAMPVVEPALAGLTALAMTVGYRFVIADREERFLRNSFSLYLAPQVIDAMLASGAIEELRGIRADTDGDGLEIGIVSGGAAVDYPAARAYFASRERAGGSSNTLWSVDFDGSSATLNWAQPLGNIDGSPVLFNGRVYVGTMAGVVYALDAASGVVEWSLPLGDGAIKGFLFPRFGTNQLFLTTTGKIWSIEDTVTSGVVTTGWPIVTAMRPLARTSDSVCPGAPLAWPQSAAFIGQKTRTVRTSIAKMPSAGMHKSHR